MFVLLFVCFLSLASGIGQRRYNARLQPSSNCTSPRGSYCKPGKPPTSIKCPAGSYQNEYDKQSCSTCLNGAYSAEGAVSCTTDRTGFGTFTIGYQTVDGCATNYTLVTDTTSCCPSPFNFTGTRTFSSLAGCTYSCKPTDANTSCCPIYLSMTSGTGSVSNNFNLNSIYGCCPGSTAYTWNGTTCIHS